MINFQRKLYALLQISGDPQIDASFFGRLDCFTTSHEALKSWWYEKGGRLANQLASTSDRINLLSSNVFTQDQSIEVRHPISGQSQHIQYRESSIDDRITRINQIWADLRAQPELSEEEAFKRLFCWCWRFYPQLSNIPLLTPSHELLPDNPIHSYNNAVSALTGALFPGQQDEAEQPYLLLFTFSPVQEFIKASRKFLDFWSGSYMLHYLSAHLCWHVAKQYGPDALITPSLWGQEIIDAFLSKNYPEFKTEFEKVGDQEYRDPIAQFNQKNTTHLSTAGFPNTLTVLVSGKAGALALGDDLKQELNAEWLRISKAVREHIFTKVETALSDSAIFAEMAKDISEELQQELQQYKQKSCWEWNNLWNAQINHTWEPYFVAVPLGHPDQPLVATKGSVLEKGWVLAQNTIASPRTEIPTDAEIEAYTTFNVGTWWGSYQARLGQLIQAIKNTRNWKIPVAPGERSSLSGQFSAVHPRLNYKKFSNGRGMSMGSMQLFWKVMGIAYPGLFNGSERLNALELTKRMAWQYGGIAQALGITDSDDNESIEIEEEGVMTETVIIKKSEQYEDLIRFPNLTSIAMANFAAAHPEKIRQYWKDLRYNLKKALPQDKYGRFCALTRRPSQIQRVDQKLYDGKSGYNGVMFSSKWLADDLGLEQNSPEMQMLRSLVDQAHIKAGFGDASPADWWVLVLGDGDSMGKYVSGNKLKNYGDYLTLSTDELSVVTSISNSALEDLKITKKRMGPATHIGLNRALIDFSNRLVPYLTEERCCGRVIYSGGDDVLATLSLADLPLFLRSLRAAWSGQKDPCDEFRKNEPSSDQDGDSGYWIPDSDTAKEKLPNRPLFTMGDGATMSLGIIVAHKSVPLPTVLENLWEAEKERAKKMLGYDHQDAPEKADAKEKSYAKNGLCFRIVYGSGNVLEALMKGHLLEGWWKWIQPCLEDSSIALAPVLYRLAEELPRHCEVTSHLHLFREATKAILLSRDNPISERQQEDLLNWVDDWEDWAWRVIQQQEKTSVQDDQAPPKYPLGTSPQEFANLLRFSAFWVGRQQQELNWTK